MTKQEYIKAHPKSMLAANLLTTNWNDDTKIGVIGGLNVPTKQNSKTQKYVLGGYGQKGIEGWWGAVRIN